jgi:hypothetical protein
MGTRGPPPGEGGRPPKDIDLTVVRRAASLGCTHEEISTLVGVERTTFWRHLEKDPELQRAIDEGRDEGRATLRRLQWQKANNGDTTMLIWLGKQMLKQRDKFETEVSGKDGGPVVPVLNVTVARE